uniref:Uncharacterized protein n=1 Tax=Solanum lycopersicum TaxID=4081 RepID=A0A3Q7ESK7_SOLLC
MDLNWGTSGLKKMKKIRGFLQSFIIVIRQRQKKKQEQILVQHIRTLLPGLKSCICAALVTAVKEHASSGEIMESNEVDPCEDLTDDDILTAIQNAMGPKSALFVQEMSHHFMVNELQRLPIFGKCMDEVIGNFLHEELGPSEMDYISTSHQMAPTYMRAGMY